MVERNAAVKNRLGIHARPAALLVKTAATFKCEILLVKDGLEINGKSIMGVMMLAAGKGTELELNINGSDEKEALQALSELINNRFGEAE